MIPPPTSSDLGAASRRSFLKTATAGAGATLAGAFARGPSLAGMNRREPASPSAGPLIDVNVSLGPWPLRRVPHDEARGLAELMKVNGVQQAWTGSLDGLLHKDLAAVNGRLAEDCRRHGRGRLMPFGSIHPKLPDWREEFRRCVEEHRMRGVRLHPNYHGYALDDPDFRALLGLAARQGLVVQIALVMEDERMMHPRLRVEPVDPSPLLEALREHPTLRVVLVNALRTLRAQPLLKLIAAGNVWVEIAMLEGIGGLTTLLEQVPFTRVLFGSHAPVFYFEAARLKLRESALAPEQERAIRHANALGVRPSLS